MIYVWSGLLEGPVVMMCLSERCRALKVVWLCRKSAMPTSTELCNLVSLLGRLRAK